MRKLLSLGAALILSLAALPAMASHFMAGQITAIRDTSAPGAYAIQLEVFYDMAGAPPPTALYVYSSGGGTTTTLVLNEVSSTNLVGTTGLIGAVHKIYSVNATFTAGSYNLIWDDCCRNGSINNMSYPSGMHIYLNTTLDVPPTLANSTPVFLNTALSYVSVNQPFAYNPLTYDADGDSTAWELDTPQDANSSVPSNVLGYTLPAGDSANPFTVNPLNGQITWTPNTIGVYVVSVLCHEYRNGVQIGSVRRDHQYHVIPDTPTAGPLVGMASLPVSPSGQINVTLEDSTNLNLTLSSTDLLGNLVQITAHGEPFLLSSNPATFVGDSLMAGTATGTFD